MTADLASYGPIVVLRDGSALSLRDDAGPQLPQPKDGLSQPSDDKE